MGAGEGTFLMAEQFTFQQRFGNSAAIDGHKGAVFAGAVLMDGLGGHFFARSALPIEQDRRIRRRHFANRLKDRAHRAAAAQHPAESVAPDQLMHLPIFHLQPCHMKTTLEQVLQFLHLDRLDHEVVGS
jgi:hypothetical protein